MAFAAASAALALPAEHVVHVWSLTVPNYWETPAGLLKQEWKQAPEYAWLSGEERQRASRYKLALLSARFVYFRGSLRNCLARYLNCIPVAVPIAHKAREKPVLEPSSLSDLHFNVAHSGNRGLIAISHKFPVGVDWEVPTARFSAASLAREILSGDAWRHWQALPWPEQSHYLLRYWTCLEALLKMQGIGLALPLPTVTIKQWDSDWFEYAERHVPGTDSHSTWIRSWSGDGGGFGAIARSGERFEIGWQTYPEKLDCEEWSYAHAKAICNDTIY